VTSLSAISDTHRAGASMTPGAQRSRERSRRAVRLSASLSSFFSGPRTARGQRPIDDGLVVERPSLGGPLSRAMIARRFAGRVTRRLSPTEETRHGFVRPTGNGQSGILSARDRAGFYIAGADIMVHMWVNTVTGCGLPRQEINGPRFGPPVDRPLVLVPPGWTGLLARQPDRERVCMPYTRVCTDP